jgi:hypothetical protein
MGNLGLMEPEQLLQLFLGSIGGAFVIFVLLVGYVVISRRNSSRGMRHGTPMTDHQRDSSTSVAYPRSPAASETLNRHAGSPLPPQPEAPRDDRASSVDVSARLAGTGREAWLEEASSPREAGPPVEEAVSLHGREVLRLVRDRRSGQVCTQVAGVRYHTMNDVRDRAVGERILAAITYALQFSNGRAASDHGPVMVQFPPCDKVRVPTAFGALSDACEDGELVRLMGDSARNHFCIHVAGHCYKRLIEIDDRATGQLVLEAITRLLQFSNGMLATNDGVGLVVVPPLRMDVDTTFSTVPSSSGPQAPQEVAGSSAPAQAEPIFGASPSPDSHSGEELEGEQERFLRQLRNQVPSAPSTLERPSLMGSIRRMRKKPINDPLPSLNLVEEIDRIFQTRLRASSMAGMDARITAASDGAVGIRVGTVYYNSPEDVPDPQLREMLKLAISEWEQS